MDRPAASLLLSCAFWAAKWFVSIDSTICFAVKPEPGVPNSTHWSSSERVDSISATLAVKASGLADLINVRSQRHHVKVIRNLPAENGRGTLLESLPFVERSCFWSCITLNDGERKRWEDKERDTKCC